MKEREIKILYLYPDMLELYGDYGNIQVLKYRMEKRNIKCLSPNLIWTFLKRRFLWHQKQ